MADIEKSHEEKEYWLPISGYEGCYSVSSLGNVRSEKRTVPNGPLRYRVLAERILRQQRNRKDGYLYVDLCKEGKRTTVRVAKLVANAFLAPASVGQYLLYGPLGKDCNAVANLCYGTLSKNDALMASCGFLGQPMEALPATFSSPFAKAHLRTLLKIAAGFSVTSLEFTSLCASIRDDAKESNTLPEILTYERLDESGNKIQIQIDWRMSINESRENLGQGWLSLPT